MLSIGLVPIAKLKALVRGLLSSMAGDWTLHSQWEQRTPCVFPHTGGLGAEMLDSNLGVHRAVRGT
jgi:hypothetical protein